MGVPAEERTFLRLIRGRPHEDWPRLIFADWLDERGDPRGEFIRVQCALATLEPNDSLIPGLTMREQQLRDANEAEWATPIRGLVSGWEFRRGMLEAVSLSAEAFLESAEEIFRRAPVRRVRLFDAQSQFARLMGSRKLTVVRELDLCGNDLGNGGLNMLIRSPHLARLERLDVSFNGISDTGLEVLAGADNLPGLRTLSLNDNGPLGPRGTGALSASTHLSRLTTLDLSACGLDGRAIEALVAGAGLTSLRALHLQSNRIGDTGTGPFANSKLFARLVRIANRVDLRHNEIGQLGAARLFESHAFREVAFLDLTGNLLGDDGISALIDSPHVEGVRDLRLRDNRIGDDGAVRLAGWPYLDRLEHLDLKDNPLTVTGIAAIRQSPNLNWRTVLDVPEATEWTPRSARSLERLRARAERRRRSG